MFALTCNSAWGQTTVEFDATADVPASGGGTAGKQTLTKDGITITISSGVMKEGQYRCYKSSTMTITSTVGDIYRIVFTCTADGTSQYGPGCFTADTETYTASTGKKGTWKGKADNIVFKASSNQVRMTKVKVTYGGMPEEVDISNTAETAYSVAKAHELIAEDEGLSTEVYVKGIVTSVESFSSTYGSITYYIGDTSDDANPLKIYGGLYYNGDMFNSMNDMKVGDEVVVKGLLLTYNGTDEMDKNNVVITQKRDGKDVEQGKGTDISNKAETAYSVAKSIELIDAGEGLTNKVYVKGYIVGTPNVSTSNGYATYEISDTNGDATTTLTVYHGYYLENTKFTATDQIAVGDEVIVYGNLTLYTNTKDNTKTYELNSGNYIYSKNGVTGISNVTVDEENANAPTYNTAGQRVSKSYKGLVIKNGKKYVQK